MPVLETAARRALRIHAADNVAVVLEAVAKGEVLDLAEGPLVALEDIPRGHKIALTDVSVGEDIRKYGYPIGQATQPITRGAWVHTHNLRTKLGEKLTYTYQPSFATPDVEETLEALPDRFEGFVRENGDVGIRNELWVLPTVGCVNKTVERLVQVAQEELAGHGIDGVYAFPHPYGCSQLGDDLGYTQKAMAGLIRHPNAAGVLVVGLGCENNQIESLKTMLGDVPPEKIRFMALQSVDDEFTTGLAHLRELAEYASRFQRSLVPVQKLRIGLKCGGSDGFSGITANPLVGRVADLFTARGATALLTEVPEMFGAETILMNRAQDEGIFADIVQLINDFKDYYIRHGQVIYENPSPGNKDGGITTLEEKSLGCVQKGGQSPITGVRAYGAPATGPGLQLVQAPGNDLVSVTALALAGAHLVLFTTGRGTPFGGPVPTLKISTNTQLYEHKRNWIDFDAGRLVGGAAMVELAAALYRQILDVASGLTQTQNERFGYREIAIFKDGVTL
ncbi:MAG: altronate dehydratase family protein [Alicyclobacillus herbarius]|uniref:UxaA family hydrolase n=1 Tax=Alicyclobacillus herbarius TaxID=122960 RepID=UPI002357D1A7|nr:altronate dehydratase family protein [Alicyclobacillus herbarius]MCL6633642.1 altronate dehydratase family protein [Alicyclobacillus herbarius]